MSVASVKQLQIGSFPRPVRDIQIGLGMALRPREMVRAGNRSQPPLKKINPTQFHCRTQGANMFAGYCRWTHLKNGLD